MTSIEKKAAPKLTKVQQKALLAICFFAFGIYFGGMTNTNVAYIINSYPQYAALDVSRVQTIPPLVGLIVSFSMAGLALKVPKKILATISLGSMFIKYMIFFLVGSMKGPLALLFVGSFFQGITVGSHLILVNSYIAAFFPQERRATFVALSTALASAGSTLVNMVGGAIAAGNGGADWPKSYLLGFIELVLIILFLVLMPKEPTAEKAVQAEKAADEPEKEKVKVRIPVKIFALIAVGICMSLSLCAYLYFIARYVINDFQLGTSLHTGFARSLYSFSGLFIGLTYGFWHKLFKKYIPFVGLILFTISNFMLWRITTSIGVVYAASIMISVGFNLYNPYYVSQIMAVSPKSIAPLTLSLQVAGINIASFVALDIITFCGEALGPRLDSMFLVGTIGGVLITIAGFFVYIVWKNPPKPEDEEAAAAEA